MRRSLIALISAGLLAITLVAPTSAITKGGVVDTNNDYPYVGLMVAFVDGAPAWRCSGTLVSPKLYVTAGHCTDGADHVEIWFDVDLTDAELHNYPAGPGDASGTPYTHPDYDPNAFYLHDLGVVVLDGKGYDTGGEYATLLGQDDEGLLDGLAVGTPFITVGYGLQSSYPAGTPADARNTRDERIRMIATPKLMQYAGDYALHLSMNSKTGGTCFGDSGGPTFYNGVLVGVTSYVYTETCAGRAGMYRLDTSDDLNWLYSRQFAKYL